MRRGSAGQLEAAARVGGQQRQQSVSRGRGPELNSIEGAKGPDQIASAALEGRLGARVVPRRTPYLGGENGLTAALQALRVLRVDGGADLAQEAQVALPGRALHGLELVAEHRCQPHGHGHPVEHVEQRQVDAGHRLPQPFLAEGPGAEALHVGHVRVQYQGQRAARLGAHAGIGVGARPARRAASTQPSITRAPITRAGTAAISSEATTLNAACVAITANSEPVRS